MSGKKKTSWIVWGSAILLLMLVAYPLSIGPVFALCSTSYAESLFEAVGPHWEDQIQLVVMLPYWPLEQISDAFPEVIGASLQAYVDWWTQGITHSPPIPASAPLPAPPISPAPTIESL